MEPTEGTILTVARKMAEKAEEAYEEEVELDDYLVKIIAEGQLQGLGILIVHIS